MAVERKGPGLYGGNGDPTIDTGKLFGVEAFIASDNRDQDNTLGELHRYVDGTLKSFLDAGL